MKYISSDIFFRKIGIRSDILFRKIGIRSGILFQKIGIRDVYVFEASMARPRPKSGQVHPPGQDVSSHFQHFKKIPRLFDAT